MIVERSTVDTKKKKSCPVTLLSPVTSVTQDSRSLSPRCGMKMIAVQTIIYDVYLARTGNCDIGTSHKCETVGPKQYGTEHVRNGFIA